MEENKFTDNGGILMKKDNKATPLILVLIIIMAVLIFSSTKSKENINNNDYKTPEYTSKQDVEKFKNYIGNNISGYKVIELLNMIYTNNSMGTNEIIKIDSNFTEKHTDRKINGENIYTPEDIKSTLISGIDITKNYIIKAEFEYSSCSGTEVVKKIIISDESKLSNKEVQEYNNFLEGYLGSNVIGKRVKELIKYVKDYDENQYKNNEENYIRILMHVDKSNTQNQKSYYLLTGINRANITSENFLSEYIDAIKDNVYYYVDVHEYNPDGTIYIIVISDLINKYNYENSN